MQTRHSLDPLQPKTWQLETTNSGTEGYLYYCILCDEALALSITQISPKRMNVAFDGRCPNCGFDLDRVLGCKSSILPAGRRLLTSLRCRDTGILGERGPEPGDQPRRASSLLGDGQFTIPSGIEQIDKTLVLTKCQLVFLQGEQSHSLSILFCATTALPPPHGLDSNVVFIDGGNLFDTTATPQHGIVPGLDNAKAQERIHLSRAFTHHQVYNLIMSKLPDDIKKYHPTLVVVSDMTALFCDPDVREKRESLNMFKEASSSLARLAGNRQTLILVTCAKTRNRKMEEALSQASHVSASLRDNGFNTQLKITKHPFLREGHEEVNLEHDALTRHFRQHD